MWLKLRKGIAVSNCQSILNILTRHLNHPVSGTEWWEFQLQSSQSLFFACRPNRSTKTENMSVLLKIYWSCIFMTTFCCVSTVLSSEFAGRFTHPLVFIFELIRNICFQLKGFQNEVKCQSDIGTVNTC
jgi:hypothetical protein